MTEVGKFKVLGIKEEISEVDVFFKAVAKLRDPDNGSQLYPLLVRLGYALATMYNSSSSAERDFSLLNASLADKHKNSSSLLLLEAKMHIKAECRSLARQCKECQEMNRQGKESTHCHCEKWKPKEELMETMRNSGPWQRYKADLEQCS